MIKWFMLAGYRNIRRIHYQGSNVITGYYYIPSINVRNYFTETKLLERGKFALVVI